MAKTIICLVLTAVFAFLSLSSYADTDAPRMRQWMAYYEEYQALKTLGDRSDDAKMTLLNKLRTMYPEKAAIYETKFKEEFGDLEAKAKAEKEIKRIDKQRANHYKYYTEKEWNNSANYDISINSDTLGVEKTAELICQIVEEKIETK